MAHLSLSLIQRKRILLALQILIAVIVLNVFLLTLRIVGNEKTIKAVRSEISNFEKNK
jgi:hypothetical protein